MSRKVTSLSELSGDIAPARDLWPGIDAAIGHGRAGASRRWQPVFAAAAALALLAVGIWLGRASVVPDPQMAAQSPASGLAAAQPEVVPAAWSPDARYSRTRDQLMREASARLATLPPETKAKVQAGLEAVQKARVDIEQALGHDPGNALLQEMLVNTYQDEMRVLAAVRDTWTPEET